MDEIIPGLWIGDLPSALDTKKLKENNVFSVLSAMRGKITVHETFIKHQIQVDDTEEENILAHFLPSITFIQSELDKGRGVLVHCQAGMSRSATIVAAYLMYTQKLDPEQALDLIREHRPNICPNSGFLNQLEVFHEASFKISRSNKVARRFYLERTLGEVMNGDGTLPETDMFAKFPRTPNDSGFNTPIGPRRRIRCKMCRQELAAREHMLDHGQLNPPTPAAQSPANSRRPSSNNPSRRPSFGQRTPLDTRPRRPSVLGTSEPMSSVAETEKVEEIPTSNGTHSEGMSPAFRRRSSSSNDPKKIFRPFAHLSRGVLESLSMSALEDDEGDDLKPIGSQKVGSSIPAEVARAVGRNMSESVIASRDYFAVGGEKSSEPTVLASPTDLAAQLFANPKLAALRSTELAPGATSAPFSLPIIANPKCSGYFVEPMKWMEPFLESGQLAGKIVCPNKKCGVKLGNYDWAGVCCSCKQWVTPGFCIHRSKVDEIVV